eukprot:COSAG03_NODE_1058_length_4933_cov_40.252586_4_plen_212_part_00
MMCAMHIENRSSELNNDLWVEVTLIATAHSETTNRSRLRLARLAGHNQIIPQLHARPAHPVRRVSADIDLDANGTVPLVEVRHGHLQRAIVQPDVKFGDSVTPELYRQWAAQVGLDLTTRALAQGHVQRGGPGRFADALRPGNFFEAVAVAVTRGCEVLPHMDRENDHRDGWNVMGALTFCGQDEKGPFRVGVFGYTRKCVGDYLDWEAAQ